MEQIKTKRGYDLLNCASALQKSIRRADTFTAAYFTLELQASGFANYAWKRLLTISAEDVYGIVTKEIIALYQAWEIINKGKSEKEKGRIFLSKAVLLLCNLPKNRDSDHLSNYVYDNYYGLTEEEIKNYLKEVESEGKIELPDYTFDCHTMEGKRKGKTKKEFFKDELKALNPYKGSDLFEATLFD